MSKIVDWYSVIPKTFLQQSHNPHESRHHLTIPMRMLMIGSSGSGKTQSLLSIIHSMPDTFQNIFIITKNKDEPLYNYLESQFKGHDGFSIKEGISELPDIDTLNKKQNNLIVLDDLVGERNQKPIEEFFLRARKKNCSMIYLSQSYYAVPKMIRNNLTYLLIKQVSSMKNLTMIAREYSLGYDKSTIHDIYKDATANKQSFLLLDLDHPDRKFRKDFSLKYVIDEATENISLELI